MSKKRKFRSFKDGDWIILEERDKFDYEYRWLITKISLTEKELAMLAKKYLPKERK